MFKNSLEVVEKQGNKKLNNLTILNKRVNKSNKGISLIVLVITIIVIIILGAAVILTLTNNNPIENAKQAAFVNDLSNLKSELSIWLQNEYVKNNGELNLADINITKTTSTYNGILLSDIFPKINEKYSNKIQIREGKIIYVDMTENNQKEKEWAKKIDILVQEYPLANKSVQEGQTAIAKLENTTITGEYPSYNNPIIPAGFFAINTENSSWLNKDTDYNKGLVIQDESGNQFVWIPVDGEKVKYEKWCTQGENYSESFITDDILPNTINNENLTDTISNKYKGFYIARYESSFDYNFGEIRVASKKSINKTSPINWSTTRTSIYDGYLWNSINYIDAKFYSELMATNYGYDESKIKTGLLTGQYWDTTMKWLEVTGINVDDSSLWGNYSGELQVSGYSNIWRANNIYDLAGNVWEWTNEKRFDDSILRGGRCYGSGSEQPASFRAHNSTTYLLGDMGFRVALYIK